MNLTEQQTKDDGQQKVKKRYEEEEVIVIESDQNIENTKMAEKRERNKERNTTNRNEGKIIQKSSVPKRKDKNQKRKENENNTKTRVIDTFCINGVGDNHNKDEKKKQIVMKSRVRKGRENRKVPVQGMPMKYLWEKCNEEEPELRIIDSFWNRQYRDRNRYKSFREREERMVPPQVIYVRNKNQPRKHFQRERNLPTRIIRKQSKPMMTRSDLIFNECHVKWERMWNNNGKSKHPTYYTPRSSEEHKESMKAAKSTSGFDNDEKKNSDNEEGDKKDEWDTALEKKKMGNNMESDESTNKGIEYLQPHKYSCED